MMVAILVAALTALVALVALVRMATAPSRADALVALHLSTTALAVCVWSVGAGRSDATLGVAGVMILIAGWAGVWALAQHNTVGRGRDE